MRDPRYAERMGTQPAALRRLIELPGGDALEYKAILKRDFAEPEARAANPEIDACTRALFGITADEAEALPRPADWDDIECKAPAVQVAAFEAAGWDVTDDKRRPLRVLGHFSGPLWLALRGVAGTLPFQPDSAEPEAWVSKLEAEAKRFRKR
jgi:cytochrome P450